MKYNLAKTEEAGEALVYLLDLTKKGVVAEVKKISPKRTINQNNYLHLLFGAFGAHFGYTVEEAKQIYKELNQDIYSYTKEHRGKKRTFWRSSADISKEDMAKSIDRFMTASAEAGYTLPPATDQGWLRAIENEIERSKAYL